MCGDASGDIDAGDKALAEITRARLLRPHYDDYGSPPVEALPEELLNDKAAVALTDDEPVPKPRPRPCRPPAPPEDSKHRPKPKPSKPKPAKINE
eukprot:jgi/Tetstr1/439657/TSEL_028078.t1